MFKMKPLKAENEVGSNMKSTIRYTFVAPGAIGKGRGRGLKSLGEKVNTPSKSFLPQSSDLVNKYIKEIETMHPAAIRKGLEKRSGSLSSSLGFSETEVGYLNKSDVCANQHMETPSKSTKSSSTFSSSQKMQKMKRIVLEKDDMQTNVSLPPSSDHVMKHSQTTKKDFVDIPGYHMTKTKL
ncbi:hypothetical protein H5410_051581 [Solanum commersonii]|uniref:Uncharacterized protein n=1 Tax=Solanum commersonii TaxID=4109 RepID=A0A9J5WYV5_SOLCO|nr:hypothetical protein H5410_051581 [Solanum commersonii]